MRNCNSSTVLISSVSNLLNAIYEACGKETRSKPAEEKTNQQTAHQESSRERERAQEERIEG
jgi:hypothetical protein